MFLRHVKMAAWGIGILLEERGGQRTVMFADGQKRTFKVALADQLLVAAEPASEEERQSLLRAHAIGGVAPPMAVNLALEAQLATGFDDPGPFVVYADWLQQKGNPRGDLIHAQARRAQAIADGNAAAERKATTAEQKLMREHAGVFLPDAFRRKGDFALEWRYGFIAAAQIGHLDSSEGDARLGQLLAHPSTQYLQELVLTAGIYEGSPIGVIARSRHANLMRLVIGAPVGESALEAGDITELFALPGLVELTVSADALAVRAPIVNPRLRRLAIAFRRDESATFDHLATPDTPALAHLDLDCVYGFDGPPVAAFARCPALKTLIVRHTTQTSAWLQSVYTLPACAQLERLAFPDGDLDDTAIPELLAKRALFPKLVALDFSNNHLSTGGERLIADFALEVRARGLPARDRRAGLIRDAVYATPAARELATVARWEVIGYDRVRDRAWGEYQGSRGIYAVFAERAGPAGCSCPSFQRPCKHAIALRLMLAENTALPDRAPTSDRFYDNALARPRFDSTGE